MTDLRSCECLILGDPVPKGRPRHGRNGHTYTPVRTEAAEQAIGWALRIAHTGRPMLGPIWVRIYFRCATKRRCDIDNLAKLVLDAGNGVVYADDQQVVRLLVDVDRGCANPSTRIWIEEAP